MIFIFNLKDTILRLTKKYNTSNPFELADVLKISVFYEELGTINGYYNKPFRMKQIHINQNLNEQDAKFTCAHELGHAIGLDHNNGVSVMYPKGSVYTIQPGDIKAVQKLYKEK